LAVRRVIVESPFAGVGDTPEERKADADRKLRYLRACLRDCILRGETPYASHALLTQPGVLRDDVPEERKAGILAGFRWRSVADATVVYLDLGISSGMNYGIDHAEAEKEQTDHVIEYRRLGGEWSEG
jgi:hypothetical protein